MPLLNASRFLWGLLILITVVSSESSVAIGASSKKSAKAVEKSLAAISISQSAESDYRDFKAVLKNMTKKTLSDFIDKNPNNFYTVLAKINLTAIEETADGFGKCVIVLKNKTRLNVQQVTTKDKRELQFSDKVHVDPSTIAYIELHSTTEELEPYIEYKWGQVFKYSLGMTGVLSPLEKGNSLLATPRTNGVIKYKLKTSLETWHPSGEILNKFDLIDILKKNANGLNLEKYIALTEAEQKVVVATLMDITWAVDSWNGSEYKYFKNDTLEKLLDFMKTERAGENTRIVGALNILPGYSLIAENDLLVLPSTHGKDDYYPFVVSY